VRCDLGGTDDPVCEWEYAGSNYRLSIVAGLLRFEQQIRGGGWYLIEPDHDTTAMMICAEQLSKRLDDAEQSILRWKGERLGELYGRGEAL
jgi:hypothetical protein